MLPEVHCHRFLPVHSHLPPSPPAASQLLHVLVKMLPEVHCHSVLPVHSHLPPSPPAASQLLHDLLKMLPEVHSHSVLPVHLHLPPSPAGVLILVAIQLVKHNKEGTEHQPCPWKASGAAKGCQHCTSGSNL